MTDDTTARSVQGLIGDPELIPPALDLSRPELIEVMDRYRSRSVTTPVFRQPVALIVRRPGLPSLPIEDSIQGAAYTTRAATVGGLRDPRTFIETIGRLLVRVRNR